MDHQPAIESQLLVPEQLLNDFVLRQLWQRSSHSYTGSQVTAREWNDQVAIIHHCGKGLEETLRYLYQQKPSFETFVAWMSPDKSRESVETSCDDVLTSEDIIFFKENGYVVIPHAVTHKQCEGAREAILEFLGASLTDPATWYKDHEEQRGLMLMLYHHPALDDTRNSPRIRKAYEQLYGSANMDGAVDKVSFNPPETSAWKFKGSLLHWDVSLVLPIPFKLQGLLYLNDVDANGGAFQCVAGFHNQLEGWLKSLPPNVNPRDEAVLKLRPKPVTGKAGDFIIWHQALPHCASANYGHTPRFVQYNTFIPVGLADQEVWK